LEDIIMGFFPLNKNTEQDGAGAATAEQAPTVKPVYDINETAEAYGLVVYLPGVSKENLEVTAQADHIRIFGKKAWKQPEGWTSLYRESGDEAYELMLSHENAIDVERVRAELRDGVLRVSLPKAESRKPRKIAVN
jgi:HSP20 family molecular chaperone IbpA